jgi:GGDEF domain-containing protein
MESLNNILTSRHIAENELSDTKKELSDIKDCFSVIIENMSHGVSVFDKEHRLVLCNKKFVEMYVLPQPLQRSGTSLSKIIEFSQSTTFGEEVESSVTEETDWINRKLASMQRGAAPQRRKRTLSNGRIIQVTFYPLTAGGGWVDLHEDITGGSLKHLGQDWDSNSELSERMLTRSKFYAGVNNALARMTEEKGGALYLAEVGGHQLVRRAFGLAMRDQLVAEVGKTLMSFVRPDDLVARLDGDLLGIFLVEVPQKQDLSGFASRLHAALNVERVIEGRKLDAAIRMGGAAAPRDGNVSETLVNVALSRISA